MNRLLDRTADRKSFWTLKFVNAYLGMQVIAWSLMAWLDIFYYGRGIVPEHLAWFIAVGGHWWFYCQNKTVEFFPWHANFGPALLLFEAFSTLLVCHYYGIYHQSPLFLIFLSFPIVAGNIIYLEGLGPQGSQSDIAEGSRRAVAYFFVMILGIFITSGLLAHAWGQRAIANPLLSSNISSSFFQFQVSLLFLLGIFGLSWYGLAIGKIEQKHFIFDLLKKMHRHFKRHGQIGSGVVDGQVNDQGRYFVSSPYSEERLFYHDLINQLHGMGLFLEGHNKGELTSANLELLQKEIKLTQSMVENYFHLPHKNSVSGYFGKAKFVDLLPMIEQQIDRYCRSQGMQVQVFRLGDLSLDRPVAKQQECTVHAPSLMRITTNILKNIWEGKAMQVEIYFESEAGHLFLTFKNSKLGGLNKSEMANVSSEGLAQIILTSARDHQEELGHDTFDSREGNGLESVDLLCQKLGGQMQFQFENNHWNTSIRLPYYHEDESLSVGTTSNDLAIKKKAA